MFDCAKVGQRLLNPIWISVSRLNSNAQTSASDLLDEGKIRAGFRKCEEIFGNLRREKTVSDDRVSPESISDCHLFFKNVTDTLQCFASRNICTLARAGLKREILRGIDHLFTDNGNVYDALNHGALFEWCKIYCIFFSFCLRWLKEIDSWEVLVNENISGMEDFGFLLNRYSFSKLVERLLRTFLYVLAEPSLGRRFENMIGARLKHGPHELLTGQYASIECILQLWSEVILFLDEEPCGYWRKLQEIVNDHRIESKVASQFTLPHLRERPRASQCIKLLHCLSSTDYKTCVREEAMEFWWLSLFHSMIVYYLFDVPRQPAWDFLSFLLSNSPLVGDMNDASYEDGSLFGVDLFHSHQCKGLYEAELIDRCSVCMTLWPFCDEEGRATFSNLKLIREINVQAYHINASSRRGLISELWRILNMEKGTDLSARNYHASPGEFQYLGKLPNDYPFDVQNKTCRGSTVCSNLVCLIQNIVLRTQGLDHKTAVACKNEYISGFVKM